MFVSAVTNALSKIALDALIQRDVVETLRSSAFARSETFLQLAWVLGAGVGVLLPSTHGGGDRFLGGRRGRQRRGRGHGAALPRAAPAARRPCRGGPSLAAMARHDPRTES